MIETDSPAEGFSSRQGTAALAASFALFLVIASAYAATLGGFRQEFLSDAAIHYVTTLLTRDYLRHLFVANPLTFLDDYYRHYPLAGFGLWPPIYYALSGLWTLLFGAGRFSVVLYAVAMAAGSAAVMARLLWARLGATWAILAGAITILMAGQASALQTMLIDPLCGLTALIAATLFARFIEKPSIGNSLWFAIAALVALFTKGNALALGLLPPLAIMFTGQWNLLRAPSLWLSGIVVALPALPWYFATAGFAEQGFRYHAGPAFTALAVPANLLFLVKGLGGVALASAAWGLWVRWRSSADWIFWRTMAALVAACFVFQSIVPAALNLRYLFIAFLPLAAFAAAGAADLARRFGRSAGFALAASILVNAGVEGLRLSELDRLGLAPVAAAAIHATPPRQPILIAASAIVEAGLIAEIAGADPERPSRYVVRGSKLLGGGGYFATDYEPRYATPEAAGAVVDRIGFATIIIEESRYALTWRHIQQLRSLAAEAPARWHPLGVYIGAQGRRFTIYRLTGSPHSPDIDAVRAINANPILARFAA